MESQIKIQAFQKNKLEYIQYLFYIRQTIYMYIYNTHTQSKIFTYCLTNDVLVILNDTRNCRIEINIEECCGE